MNTKVISFTIIGWTCLLTLWTSPAQAKQDPPSMPNWMISVKGGVGSVSITRNEWFEPFGGVQIGYNLESFIPLSHLYGFVQGSYHPFTTFPLMREGASSWSTLLEAGVIRFWPVTASFLGSASITGGILSFSMKDPGQDILLQYGSDTFTQHSFGLTARVGIHYVLTSNILISLEGGWRAFFPSSDRVAVPNKVNTTTPFVSVGSNGPVIELSGRYLF